jgi:hypothetical protein
MKYNAILPKDDDDYYLWYDSLKGWRLNIRGVGNHSFNAEAEILFEIERERIIKLLEDLDRHGTTHSEFCAARHAYAAQAIALIKGENK